MEPTAFDTQLAALQAAFAADASADARSAGLDACRSLLATLQPAPQPAPLLSGTPPTMPAAMQSTQGQLEAMLGLLHQARAAGASPDQIVALVLGKVRSLLPEGLARPSSGAFRFPLAPMPRGKAGAP